MAQNSLFTYFAIVVVVLGGVYQLHVKPLLNVFGVGRPIDSIGNQNCTKVQGLEACEKIVLHQPTGVLYLACSTPSSRAHWTPTVDRLNATGMSSRDFVVTFNPATSEIKRLKIANYHSPRGLSLHGMDVVPSSSDPKQLFVYLINHRKPLGGKDAHAVGADSAIEIFKTTVGGDTLTYLKTVEDPVIITPNDVVGLPDGKSFFFTNDNAVKRGFSRQLAIYFGTARTSVGYCHIDNGCKFAKTGMQGNNGIARGKNDTFYVGNALRGGVSVLERQSDNTLVLTGIAGTEERPIDNLSVDDDGIVWGAGLPQLLKLAFEHFSDNTVLTASSGIRISQNTGANASRQKFQTIKAFEDNGTIASGTTSVVHDSQRGLLFLHGLCATHLTICKI